MNRHELNLLLVTYTFPPYGGVGVQRVLSLQMGLAEARRRAHDPVLAESLEMLEEHARGLRDDLRKLAHGI